MYEAGLSQERDNPWGELFAYRCKHALCPYCPTIDRGVETRKQCERFRSIEPQPEPSLELRHMVLTTPSETWDWICLHRGRAIEALGDAFTELLAEVHHVEPRGKLSAAQVARGRFGGVFAAHIFGDGDDPNWPRVKPHLDVCLSLYQRFETPQGKVLKEVPKWPESWKLITSLRWARLAKKHLVKAGLPVEIQAAIAPMERFSINVSGPRRHHKAAHSISYMVRPMIDLREAWIDTSPDGEATLYYPARDHGDHPIEHKVPLGIFVSKYYQVRTQFLEGTERIHSFGFMAKGAYAATARLAGHKPVVVKRAKDDPERRIVTRRWRQTRHGIEERDAHDPRAP